MLLPEIDTFPVSVDAPVIVAFPLTDSMPVTVANPSPRTLKTVVELSFWAAIRVNPSPLALFDRTLSTVPAYAPLSFENTSIALVAASAPAVVLVSASVLLTVTAPVSVD